MPAPTLGCIGLVTSIRVGFMKGQCCLRSLGCMSGTPPSGLGLTLLALALALALLGLLGLLGLGLMVLVLALALALGMG